MIALAALKFCSALALYCTTLSQGASGRER
jgi:hypothetical protein